MSESKDGDDNGRRSPHMDVSEDKMYDSRLRGNYDLHDLAHSSADQDRQRKVRLAPTTYSYVAPVILLCKIVQLLLCGSIFYVCTCIRDVRAVIDIVKGLYSSAYAHILCWSTHHVVQGSVYLA